MSSILKDKYGWDNWFDWCMDNWETDMDIVTDDSIGTPYFYNRICPPIKGIINISKQFSELTFIFKYKNLRMKMKISRFWKFSDTEWKHRIRGVQGESQ